MPSINDLFPSKWLAAADLKGAATVVTIEKVDLETMKGQDGKPDELKPVVFFHEFEKGMVCNKTNATTISTFYGDDTDDWIGEWVTLFPTKVQFGTKMVDALRVDTKLPKKAKPNIAPAPVQAAPITPVKQLATKLEGEDDVIADEDIPF